MAIDVMCVKSLHTFLLPGTNKAYDQGYLDDGEHGGGRRLMRLLTNQDMYGVTVVVVRHYGQQLLGKQRFEIITQAASSVLENLRSKKIEDSELIVSQKKTLYS